MTDPSKDLSIDAFFGLDPEPAVPPEHEAAEAAALASMGNVTPVGVAEPTPAPDARPEPSTALSQLSALVWASKHGDVPHVVSVYRDADGNVHHVTCPCKAGSFNPRGCWAMRETLDILGVNP